MMMNTVQIQPLTIENFQPFGEVICCDGHDFFHINDAHTERYHALVETEIEGEAKAGISIFRNIKASVLPLEISMLERHPKGSQAFIPLQQQKFLIIVAPAFWTKTPLIFQNYVLSSRMESKVLIIGQAHGIILCLRLRHQVILQ